MGEHFTSYNLRQPEIHPIASSRFLLSTTEGVITTRSNRMKFRLNLRENEYNLAVPQPRTEFYKISLSYSGSVLWNSLPLESEGAEIDIPLFI